MADNMLFSLHQQIFRVYAAMVTEVDGYLFIIRFHFFPDVDF